MSAPSTPAAQSKPSKIDLANTVEKVRKNVNTLLEKNSILDSYAQSAAKTGQKFVSSYAPQALQYLPEKEVGKELVFTLAIFAIILLLIWVGAKRLIVDITCIAYPCYASILAIESKTKDDDTQWLTYWIIYLAMKITDNITYPLLRLFPMYSLVKVLFMAWLYHPDFLGAKIIYSKVQPRIQRLLLAINPTSNVNYGSKSATGGNKTVSRKNGNSLEKEKVMNSQSDDYDDTHLAVTIEKVQLYADAGKNPMEKNIYVEAIILPKEGRERQGLEEVCLKTPKILGTACVFNHNFRFTPLTVLDGTLKVQVFDKATFSEEADSLGVANINLLDLIPGGPKIIKTIKLSSLTEITMHLELNMGRIEAKKVDVYVGERNESGQYHGYGHLEYAAGGNYKGNFFKGKKHGNGVLQYANLDKYIGEFRDDNRHGEGEMHSSTNKLISRGKWIDDRLLD